MGLFPANTSFWMLLKLKGRQILSSHIKLVVLSKVCLRLKLKAKTKTQIKKLKVYKSCLSLKQGNVCMLSHVQVFVIPWTEVIQAPLSMGQARILEWAAISYFRVSSQPADQTHGLSPLLHWQVDSLPLHHLGSPSKTRSSLQMQLHNAKCAVTTKEAHGAYYGFSCVPWIDVPDSSVHGDSPGKNTGVGCHGLLQGVFPTEGLNPCLPHRSWFFTI